MKRLQVEHIAKAAQEIACEPAVLEALIQVESAGSGFIADGRPRILFEGHVFYRQLITLGEDVASLAKRYPNIVYPKWTKSFYGSASKEWERLETAKQINLSAALSSCSWGLFQIMGFNHAACSFPVLADFVQAMYSGEEAHLQAFLHFVKAKGLIPHLQKKNWAAFAKAYNGPAFAKNGYDSKLSLAYQRCLQKEPSSAFNSGSTSNSAGSTDSSVFAKQAEDFAQENVFVFTEDSAAKRINFAENLVLEEIDMDFSLDGPMQAPGEDRAKPSISSSRGLYSMRDAL